MSLSIEDRYQWGEQEASAVMQGQMLGSTPSFLSLLGSIIHSFVLQNLLISQKTNSPCHRIYINSCSAAIHYGDGGKGLYISLAYFDRPPSPRGGPRHGIDPGMERESAEPLPV